MLWGVHLGGLELRSEGGEVRLSGRFPYGQETVLREGGNGLPELREVFAPRAFRPGLDRLSRNIHLLAQHDFGKPMASVGNGTLEVRETDDALLIEARIKPSLAKMGYVADTVAAVEAGLITGLSPGFRIAAGDTSETVERRGDAILRTVRAAMLEEVSIVTRPAYPTAQVEARNWTEGGPPLVLPDRFARFSASNRWR